MKLDGSTIAIERRSLGECIDLGFLFYRAHFPQLFGLVLCFAVPACMLSYWIADNTDAGMFLSLLLFLFWSPFLGAAVVAGSGHQVFGDPISVSRALGLFGQQFFRLLIYLILTRIVIFFGYMFFLFPGFYLSVRYGFFQELILLEKIKGGRLERRLTDLLRGMVLRLVMRFHNTCLYHVVVVLVLFVLLDLASGILINMPIFLGRISYTSLDLFTESFFNLLYYDPLVVTALNAVMWLTYPLARLAWFFTYLDLRIHKECWDLEIDFKIEARRLETVS